MADIEKVIKGLESCTTYAFAEKEIYCEDLECPYLSDGVDCWGNLNKDALELLKEYKTIKETMSDEIHKTEKMFCRTAGDNKIPLKW